MFELLPKNYTERIFSNPYQDLDSYREMFAQQRKRLVFKLKGIESLTDIDIALTKVFRNLNRAPAGAMRICIDVISDVLLMHHTVNTRRWLSALLPTLKSKGFTTLAIVDSQRHPREELSAILGSFNGEIKIAKKETEKGPKKVPKITKLHNQEYLEDEVTLTKEGLKAKP